MMLAARRVRPETGSLATGLAQIAIHPLLAIIHCLIQGSHFMHASLRPLARLCLISLAAMLGACGTSKPPVYQNEAFGDTNTYSHVFPSSPAETCEAARRALMSQGYVITQFKPESINGRKNFQPQGDVHAEIEFHVVCAADGKDGKSSIAFVNALQDHYALKKINNSASLGMG